MAFASIGLGVLSIVLTVAGFYASVVSLEAFAKDPDTPMIYVASAVSFAAPLVSLVGMVLAGVGISRTKRTGEPATVGWVALVINILAFLPSITCAVFCGGCTSMMGSDSFRERAKEQMQDGGIRGNYQWKSGYELEPEASEEDAVDPPDSSEENPTEGTAAEPKTNREPGEGANAKPN